MDLSVIDHEVEPLEDFDFFFLDPRVQVSNLEQVRRHGFFASCIWWRRTDIRRLSRAPWLCADRRNSGPANLV